VNRCLAAFVLALACTGCAGKISRVTAELKAYERTLELRTVIGAASVVAGEPVPLHLTLSNKGAAPVRACVGTNHRFVLLARPTRPRDSWLPVDIQATAVDHPHCVRRFALASGEEVSWTTSVEFKDIGIGAADLTAHAQVLYPGSCDQYGCDGTEIVAPAVTLQFVR
jgi:hypothetical protein